MPLTRRQALWAASAGALACAQPAPEDAVADWIRSSAIRLKTPAAGSGLADLEPLAKLIGDARIVALGEATHSTREFFQLKHRLVEFLVTRMGFSILALETNQPEAARLNSFVRSGEGDPTQLLRGAVPPLWNTREMLDLLHWMREHNKANPAAVEVAGFDMQSPGEAMVLVREFVAKADPEYEPALARAIQLVRDAFGMTPAERKNVAREWGKVGAHLESLRPRAGAAWAIQNARIVAQCMEFGSQMPAPQAMGAVREASMAENVKWILDQSPKAKVVVWAHNFHVMTGTDPLGVEMLGMRLRKLYGDRLRTFGFAFHQGSFQAHATDGALREFTVGPAPAGSLDATLAASGIPLFALDLRSSMPAPVRTWLAAEHATRNIMTGFAENKPEWVLFQQRITERYDTLLFVEKTTAARHQAR